MKEVAKPVPDIIRDIKTILTTQVEKRLIIEMERVVDIIRRKQLDNGTLKIDILYR